MDEKKAILGWSLVVLGILVFLFIFFSVLNYTGFFADTFVERKVFENSYQYSEARKTAIATYRAQLAETEAALENPNLTEDERANLVKQLAVLRVQLRVESGR